jgi:hypothetical protein
MRIWPLLLGVIDSKRNNDAVPTAGAKTGESEISFGFGRKKNCGCVTENGVL